MISQLRQMEEQTEEELEELRSRLEKERKELHVKWDLKEEKLRGVTKKRKAGLAEELADEFLEIKKKSAERSKKVANDLEKRANPRIGEAARFLIEQITG